MVRRFLASGFSAATKVLLSYPPATAARAAADHGSRLALMSVGSTIVNQNNHSMIRFFASKNAKRRSGRNNQKPNKVKVVGNIKHTLATAVGQTRAERIKELREIAKEKILQYEDIYRKRTKGEKLPDPPPDAAHHLLQYVDNPIPNELKNSKEAIVDYILNTFLVTYPRGARLRKLQRDIAFRMDTKDMYIKNAKLQYEKILPIIGEMERAGKIKIRLGKQGRLIIYKPSESQLAVDVLNTKIDQVMNKHFANEAAVKDDNDEEEEENEEEEEDVVVGKDEEDVDSDEEEEEEEKLELSTTDYRRRYGLEEDQIDWIEEERLRPKK